MKVLITLFVVFLITTSSIYAKLDQLTVRVVYLTPTDEVEPLEEEMTEKRNALINTQRFYGKEMRRHGYGYKTFNLEKDERNRVVIHKLKGKRKLSEYLNVDLMREEAIASFGDPFIRGDENSIWVVILTGAKQVGNGGYTLKRCTRWRVNNKLVDQVCAEHSLIPANREMLLSHLIAHELGHAFDLRHNDGGELFLMKPIVIETPSSDLDIVFLSEDECRWLDAHPYFNDRPPNDAIPVVTEANKWELNTGLIRIVFTVKNKHKLHHSYLTETDGDQFVLGWGKLTNDKLSTEFLIHKHNLIDEDIVELLLIDAQGNIFYQDFEIEINDAPAAPSKPRAKTISIWAELKGD